jgi:hypothetical protein
MSRNESKSDLLHVCLISKKGFADLSFRVCQFTVVLFYKCHYGYKTCIS